MIGNNYLENLSNVVRRPAIHSNVGVRYISDPADVRSMCEGMLYRGIRMETRVIDDVERTRLICNPAFIIIWMHQDAKGLHVF